MTPAERAQLIEQYMDGYRVITEALDEAGEAGLDAREAPDEWSPREVVHHLADSEMTSAMRIRRVLVEDNPLIQGYDQEAFANRLWYNRPIEHSLDAFRLARATTAEILTRMSDADWQRTGTHTESGPYSAEDWLRIYAVHAHEHADQIRRAVA
ncbi:MAG TPA: DinB family protein [Thermomicrobiales bacterium]|nr:DinB family protein [Thermomicrobiales bacterium]